MKRLLNEALLDVRAERRALLVTGGEAPTPALIHDAMGYCSCLICADRGANAVLAAQLYPDELIGDMDSIDVDARAQLMAAGIKPQVLPTEKNFTDTQAALEYIFSQGFDEVIVLGATGGRWDHEQGNMLLVAGFGRRGKTVVLWNHHNRLRYISPGAWAIPASPLQFSMVPLSDTGMILTLQGLYYPLDQLHIPFGDSRCLSNVFVAATADVSIHDGDGWLILSKDESET